LSSSTMAKLRLSGDGPIFSKCGRSCIYAKQDLDTWVAARRRRSTSDEGEVAK
jgi:hypothetical protein